MARRRLVVALLVVSWFALGGLGIGALAVSATEARPVTAPAPLVDEGTQLAPATTSRHLAWRPAPADPSAGVGATAPRHARTVDTPVDRHGPVAAPTWRGPPRPAI